MSDVGSFNDSADDLLEEEVDDADALRGPSRLHGGGVLACLAPPLAQHAHDPRIQSQLKFARRHCPAKDSKEN